MISTVSSLLYFRNLRRPIAGSQHISHEKRLQICDPVRNFIETPVRIRNTNVLGLPSVDAASQRPAPLRIGAVVHPAVLTEKALPAESFHIYRHPVARASDL